MFSGKTNIIKYRTVLQYIIIAGFKYYQSIEFYPFNTWVIHQQVLLNVIMIVDT